MDPKYMSSNQFVLAFAAKNDLTPVEVDVRLEHASRHVDSLLARQRTIRATTNARTGIIAWDDESSASQWSHYPTANAEMAAWIHTPANAGSPENTPGSLSLARTMASDPKAAERLGAPAGLFYLNDNQLVVLNDCFGLVRIYQFEFPEFGYVWSTRPGLAHIFAGAEPQPGTRNWAGMATLGWNVQGEAHLGNGRQLPGYSRLVADRSGSVASTSQRLTWLRSSLDNEPPSLSDAAQSMEEVLQVVKWWKNRPVADLSGGKDSRVTAAAAIRAGAVNAVRTVDSDSGEVDTVRQLLRLTPELEVEHKVVPVSAPTLPKGGILERYRSLQRAWEGAYAARPAYRTAPFKGFTVPGFPRINGLGGEAIQGATSYNAEGRLKAMSAGADEGSNRLRRMVYSAGAATEEARLATWHDVELFNQEAAELEFDTAFGVVDYFYNFSKMPYWSLPPAGPSTILPFYCPALLPRIAWAHRHVTEFGTLHIELLKNLIPAWSTVPFYKPALSTRRNSWMWENPDWEDSQLLISTGAAELDNFDKEKIDKQLSLVSKGEGTTGHEVAFTRILWELTFRDFSEEIRFAAAETRKAVARLPGPQEYYRLR